jgi:hypothetical protein
MMNLKRTYALFCLSLLSFSTTAQVEDFTAVRAQVDFALTLRPWDGFGFNYVETSQTYDHAKTPQDYGGFRFLSEADRRAVVELVFGDEGLKPGLLKMFLDPLHQQTEGGTFDHETTTRSMRYFAREGLGLTRKRGDDLSIITTLYAPPAYITKQKVMRGRDLDPAYRQALANYMIDWAKFLREKERLPLKFISMHNEGESWLRWPQDGTTGGSLDEGHDYNFFWTPEQTVEMLKIMRPMLDKAGLKEVGVTNGEYTNWYRFYHWGFAKALSESKEALRNLAMITSHGFYVGRIEAGRWYGPHSNLGTDLVRAKKPALHAWNTSTAWNIFDRRPEGRIAIMDAHFVKEIYGSIYEAKVNGIIPWAGVQNHSQWWRPDPNPGTAIRVYDDGTYEIPKAYYFYKQVSRAGQPGMAVAYTEAMDSEISLIAFAGNKTKNPNTFVLTNTGEQARKVSVQLKGSSAKTFKAYRTTGREEYSQTETARKGLHADSENHMDLGTLPVQNGRILYEAPAGSVTTFYAQ